jgi:hypothetical protein
LLLLEVEAEEAVVHLELEKLVEVGVEEQVY